MDDHGNMNGHEFLKKLKRLAKRQGVEMSFDPSPRKGSHGEISYGDRFTTLKDRTKEIQPDLLRAMLRQLNISKQDFER